MTTQTMNPYEVMFLVSQQVASDFAGSVEHIRDLLSRAGAEVLALQKWDERRLAYEIDKQRRGVYFLAYVHADPQSIVGLERDCNISERIMRILVTRANHLTEEQMRAHDRGDELHAESKMRAERAAEQTDTSGARVEFRSAEPKPEAKAEPKPEAKAESKPEAKAEAKAEPKAEPASTPEAKPQGEVASEPEAKPEPVATPEASGDASAEPKTD